MGTMFRRSEKPYSWETIDVGDEYGPVEGEVTDFLIKTHAYAVDDYSSWYFRDQTPFGGRVGHPTMLAADILRLYRLGYDLPERFSAGLHSRNEMEFLKPVRCGQRVTIRGTNADKYQKRGQFWRVLQGEVVDEDGNPMVRLKAVETVGFQALNRGKELGRGQEKEKGNQDVPKGGIITGEVPYGTPTVATASRFAPEGALIPSLTKHTSLEQSVAFSGYLYGWVRDGADIMLRNHHTAPEEAQRSGNADVVVQGLVSNAYISEVCASFFGASWLTSGRLSVVFIRPVLVRDTVTVSGVVKRRVEDPSGLRMELDVWCKNQRGEMVTAGRASALI